MKIFGKDFRVIFKDLPWQYKIVVVAAALFIPMVLIQVPMVLVGHLAAKAPVPGALDISGAGQNASSMLDPSIAYNPKDKAVWMAYTSGAAPSDKEGAALLHINLAGTGANLECNRWPQLVTGFDAKTDDILAPDGQTVLRSGAWRVETPSLIYDPDDPGKEWKLYAYKYFWANDPKALLQVAQHYGMIVYKYASDPTKEWSTEQWLFSPAPDYPPPPYEQMVLLHLNQLHPSLQDVVTYARPSVIYKDGALVMTLSAFTGGTSPDRIIMIVSRDHGNSWLYAGTLMSAADVPHIAAPGGENKKPAYTKLGGATLVEQAGKVYLAAVLGDNTQRGKGTFIFGFDDFAKGLLTRDSKGVPVVLNHVPLQSPGSGAYGGGFATYTDACPLGLLTSEQIGQLTAFRIFRTYKQPVND